MFAGDQCVWGPGERATGCGIQCAGRRRACAADSLPRRSVPRRTAAFILVRRLPGMARPALDEVAGARCAGHADHALSALAVARGPLDCTLVMADDAGERAALGGHAAAHHGAI